MLKNIRTIQLVIETICIINVSCTGNMHIPAKKNLNNPKNFFFHLKIMQMRKKLEKTIFN